MKNLFDNCGVSRRRLLTTGAFTGVAMLAACAPPAVVTPTVPPTPIVSQLATDAQLIASGLASAETAIEAIPGISASVLSQIAGYVTTVQADAGQVAADTAKPSASTVQQIVTAVQAIATVVLPLVPGGSVIEAVIEAATSLLPIILAEAGVAAARIGISSPPKYAPDAARVILAAGVH